MFRIRHRYIVLLLIAAAAWLGAHETAHAACVAPRYFSSLDFNNYYYNNNNDYIMSQINNLNTLFQDVADLEANKATKEEILRQADLVASNILNDTSGVDGYAIDNALLGLSNRINNIQNAGANANIGLYNMVDETNVDDYIVSQYELDKFDGLTISLYVANANTGASTLDIQDGNGSFEIKYQW